MADPTIAKMDTDMTKAQQTERVAQGNGFIAALDQSGGSTPKALRGYGVDDAEWSGDEEMFAQIHAMRARVITSPCFGSGKVIGADRIAVMAALNITHDLLHNQERPQAPTGGATREQVRDLLERVDQALADDAGSKPA